MSQDWGRLLAEIVRTTTSHLHFIIVQCQSAMDVEGWGVEGRANAWRKVKLMERSKPLRDKPSRSFSWEKNAAVTVSKTSLFGPWRGNQQWEGSGRDLVHKLQFCLCFTLFCLTLSKWSQGWFLVKDSAWCRPDRNFESLPQKLFILIN